MNKIKLIGITKMIVPILSIFLFYQCMQDEYDFNKLDTDFEINAGVLAPVAYGSLDFKDIVSEFDSASLINTYPDGLLYLTYEDSLFSFVADDLLDIPDQDFIEYFIKNDFVFPPLWDTVTIDRNENFPFTFNEGEKLDSMLLDKGNMVFNISSDFKHTGSVQMVFPNIQLNGVPLTYSIDIDDASGSFSSHNIIPIDGYTIILNDSSTTDTTFLPVNFHVELYDSGAPLTGTEQIEISATIVDLNFDAIFGYIGDYELLSQTGQLDLGFFSNSLDGFIQFENPQINFNIKNSYGVPAEVNISRFTGFNANGDSVVLDMDPSLNPFEYAYPKLSDYFNSDTYKDTVLSINGTNSSISEFLNTLPSRLEYNMIAHSNPGGEDPLKYNFVDDNSRIDVGFEFILPLWFKADSFALKDTINLDLLNIEDDASFIEKVTITLEVSNGLPLDIDFQMVFLDSLYNPVDTLFGENNRPIISAGVIGADNTVIAPGVKTSNIVYSKPDISKLKSVKYAAIRAGLKTPTIDGNLVAVKFYTDYKVNFNMSAGLDVNANSNDF